MKQTLSSSSVLPPPFHIPQLLHLSFPPLIFTHSSQLSNLSVVTHLDTHLPRPCGLSQTSRVPPSLPCAPLPLSLPSSPRSGTGIRERRRKGHLTEDLRTKAPPLAVIQSPLSPSHLAPTLAPQADPDHAPGPKADPGPTQLTPATDTSTPALIPPALIPMVTNAPPHRPRRHHLERVTIPDPSHHQMTTRTAIKVGTTVRNQLRAATGSEENTPIGKREVQEEVQLLTRTLSTRIKLAAWSWTESDTCSGNGSTKSGAINISAAMSATSTSCHFPF